MISSLSISNYALIRQLAITPDSGLNIITGETGVGKRTLARFVHENSTRKDGPYEVVDCSTDESVVLKLRIVVRS